MWCGIARPSGGGAIDALGGDIDSARVVLDRAENSGVEVGAALASLNDARSALIKARAAVHAFDPEVVAGEAGPGKEIAAEALMRGGEALDELRFRRIGLAVSVLIIVMAIYLSVSLLTSVLMNIYNRMVQIHER